MIVAKIAPGAITVVVPVRDNQAGVDRLLRAFAELPAEAQPRSVIVVDNLSREPVTVTHGARLLRCTTPGPAAARNVGWRAVNTAWVLFLDSDCIPTETTLTGYVAAENGAIAYAGNVKALGRGLFAEYYDAQRTLLPPFPEDGTLGYLVTANALVLRGALAAAGGFRETFDSAAGEDVDLSIRLRSHGKSSFAPGSLVLHEFGSRLSDFTGRFLRYGRGNRQVVALHGEAARAIPGFTPRPFVPARLSLGHLVLALIQFGAMWWGFARAYRDALPRPKTTADLLAREEYGFAGFQITTAIDNASAQERLSHG